MLPARKDHQHISSLGFSLPGDKWAVVQLLVDQGQVLEHQVGGGVEGGMGNQQDCNNKRVGHFLIPFRQ